jgi:hypothetical protein
MQRTPSDWRQAGRPDAMRGKTKSTYVNLREERGMDPIVLKTEVTDALAPEISQGTRLLLAMWNRIGSEQL